MNEVEAAFNRSGMYVRRERTVFMLLRYLANLSTGRLILWCYLIWYLVVLVRYFDPNPQLWLTSVGLSLIIGYALFLSTTAAGSNKVRLDRWQTFRLFLMPFCVSSFAALVKGRGFILVFSPKLGEILIAAALCALLAGTVALLRRHRCQASAVPQPPSKVITPR
jgi:hypothetical protein